MIIAIIQARLGSSRLPKKVLMQLGGIPSIMHTIKRTLSAKQINDVIVAITDKVEDDPLAEYLIENDILVFRGSENDVLKRYYDAYLNYSNSQLVKGVVRITGDCPLIEPKIIDQVVSSFKKNNLQYCGTNETFAEGLDTEVFSPELLNEVHQKAKLNSEREHVALYIHAHKQEYKYEKIDNISDDSRYRITLDEAEDYKVLKSIFNNLPIEKRNIDSIKEYLDQNPEITKINSKIIRNEGLQISLKSDGE